VAAVFLLPGVEAVSAQPIVLDFEGLSGMTFVSGAPIPHGSRLSDEFLHLEVSLSSGLGYVPVVALGAGHATSGVNGIGGSRAPGVLTYDPAYPIRATFQDPNDPASPGVTNEVSVRIDLHGTSGLSVTLNAYGVHGALLDSETQPDVGGARLTVRAPGIHSVEFVGTRNSEGAAVDDLAFNPVVGASKACYADCDTSTGAGMLDVFDFLCFQDAFVSGDPYADCDGNSVLDVFDFLCFQDAFVLGCP
jgi:hypothetical protein